MKVIVVDAQWIARAALRDLLAKVDGRLDVIETINFSQALEAAAEAENIRLLVFDPHLPCLRSMDDLKTALANFAHVPFVVLSDFVNRQDMLRCLELGPAGLVSKQASEADLTKALETVLAGEFYLPRAFMQDLPETAPNGNGFLSEHGDTLNSISSLTGRQREVLGHLARGMSNLKIAVAMGLSENTVRIHISAILRTLRLDNRTQAALLAAEYLRGEGQL